MPFAQYKDFDACVLDQTTNKNKTQEEAKKICGALQSSLGGTNFVGSELDANGDLYLKYFIIDASLANNTAVGEWSVTPEAIDANEQGAVGIPFTVLPSKDLSVRGDWHPFHPDIAVPIEEHRNFAKKYAPGYVAAITKNSNILSAAVNDIKANNGRFAIVHINDPRAKEAYIKNPDLIPKAVSPGIIGDTSQGQTNVQKFDWAHLAAVPRGAFGDKATLYGSCIGHHSQCVNQLLAASIKDLDKNLTYCPIGASENILKESFSSSVFSENNSPQMSVNASTAEATPPVQNSNIPATPPAQQGAPIAAVPQTEQKTVLKLKTPIQTPQAQTVDLKEHEKLRKEFEEYKQSQEQSARKEQIKRLIPPQLFIEKGKFDEAKYNAEVEKRLSQGWDDATIQEHYNMKLEILKAQSPQPNPLAGGYVSPSGGIL